jgi:hypothetical protein
MCHAVSVPTIICPKCTAENSARSLSALTCEDCGRSIDPRESGDSPKAFVRKQRKLRRKSKSSAEPLGQDEADELLEWVVDLPPTEAMDEEPAEPRAPAVRRLSRLITAPWRRLQGVSRRRRREWIYTDTVVRMSEDELVINRYYWPFGKKRIPYTDIRSFSSRPLKAWHGQYRVQGVDHRGRWYSRDRHRGDKEQAIDLTVGRLIHPVLTPDDFDDVIDILEQKVPKG